jgi:hypothetical protein
MRRPSTYWLVGFLAALLAGCGEHPMAPPSTPEPTWKVLATGETFDDVWGCSPKAVFALGEASLFFYNGSSWTVLADPPSGSRAIWGASPENLFVIAEGGEVLLSQVHADIYHYDGRAWEVVVERPLPFPRLRDIWGSSDRDIFAVGDGGTILHYDGSTWSPMPSGTSSDLLCLWGNSSTDVYAAGAEGTVLHYDGSTWTSISTGTSLELSSIWASSSSDIYCVYSHGSVLHYDGSSWTTVMNRMSPLWSVWGSSSTDVFVGGDRGTADEPEWFAIWHFDGVSWTQIRRIDGLSARSARAIWGSSSQDVFVVGGGYQLDADTWSNGSLLLHYDGAEWRPQASSIALPFLISIRGVGGSSATDIYFVGGDYRNSEAPPVIQRFDGSAFGLSWVGREYHFKDVWATADAVFAVQDYTNEVYSFAPSLAGLPGIASIKGISSGSCVWAASSSNAFAAGYGVSRFDGSSWSPMATGTTNYLNDIWGSSETDVFAVGEAGTIVHYDGSTWSPMATETSNDLWGVWGSSSADVYAVGDAGTMIHYDGTQWKAVPSMTQNRLTGVWGSSDRDVFVVGGIILHYDGQTWTRMGTTHRAQREQKVWGSGPGDVYVTEGNRILHYGVQ